MNLKNRCILVTGGTGFLGKKLVERCKNKGATVVAWGSADVDLRDRKATINAIQTVAPNIIIHAAVQGGGIGWMSKNQVSSGQDNVRINLNVLEAGHLCRVEKLVGISSACAYPKFCPPPFREKDLWNGYPEPSNGSYALSKRIMMDLGMAYAKERGLNCVFPILANLYGPGDATDPKRAHVVADIMMRAQRRPANLTVWGTGKPTREFIYIDDAVEGILACLQAPPGEMINIGSGVETSINSLAEHILKAFDHHATIELDSNKPDGQPRKVLSTEKAKELLGWSAKTDLSKGLKQTADWYEGRQCLS